VKTPSVQVYGLGQCALDYIAKIEAYPPPDVKCEFSHMVIQGGGPVATALVALARWGLSCAFAGVLGDDLFGSMIKASLDGEGIDTSGLLVRKGFDSQFAFIAAEPGVSRRTIFWRRPTGPPPSPDEIDYNVIRGAKAVHTDGLFAEAAICACKAAKEAGVSVVVDAGSMREGMLELAQLSDYYLAYKLAELGPRVTAVTLGAKGYIALADNRIIKRPAHQVEAVDTTGCGDAFHAGFTYGVVQGWDVEKSLDLGAWSAAMVSRKLGGRAGIPTREELVRRAQ
jgi:sulfofructose kinase